MKTPWKTEISERIQFSNRKNRPLQVCLLGLALSLVALSILPSRARAAQRQLRGGASPGVVLSSRSHQGRGCRTCSGGHQPLLERRLYRHARRAEAGRPIRRSRVASFGSSASRPAQFFGQDSQRWLKWVWKQPHEPHPEYLIFKRSFYKIVDPRMTKFFPVGCRSLVRLDEVQWGGVKVNGIPPLDHPKNIPASQADYLKDGHVVLRSIGGGQGSSLSQANSGVARDGAGQIGRY